jgi:UDP-N-acetylmuramate: L-alanyl-gamma-D-glutamyl-meso-diaminopimelate ligase
MRLHILGIFGTFMGGLAKIARELGHEVTGCDAHVYPPMSDQLTALGIPLHEGYDAEQLDAYPADLYVVGNAMTRGKPVIEAILDRGLRYVSGPQWLSENLLADKWVLAVAGTHGKSTTTAMLAWILDAAGLDPGFLIGGVTRNFEITARHRASEFFVIEADEYDTAFFDKRSKFVWYHPRTAVLGNLEYDHADIFADLGAIETQFHHLVRTVPRRGRLIVNGADAALARVLARGSWSEIERFDFKGVTGTGPDWRIDADGAVEQGGAPHGTLRLDHPGRHNQLNALAAVAAAQHAGVKVEKSLEALARFRGVKRRMEVRGTVAGVTVYDDFAHHPTAIATTVDGLRRRAGRARILAVLEPRSNTMKLGMMKDALPSSLREADRVFCYAGNVNWDVAGALAPLGDRAEVHGDLDVLVGAVARAAHPGDQVLVMSNGGFGGVHDKILRALAAQA